MDGMDNILCKTDLNRIVFIGFQVNCVNKPQHLSYQKNVWVWMRIYFFLCKYQLVDVYSTNSEGCHILCLLHGILVSQVYEWSKCHSYNYERALRLSQFYNACIYIYSIHPYKWKDIFRIIGKMMMKK